MNAFQNPETLNSVAAFHELFDLPVLEKPQLPDAKRTALRITLLQEELDELKAAIANRNLVAVADALADLQYVLSGAVLEFGLGEKFKALFEEVQRSNMSKASKTRSEAEATARHYQMEKRIEAEIIPRDSHFLVYRKADKKVLKSIHYSPADLKAILARAD